MVSMDTRWPLALSRTGNCHCPFYIYQILVHQYNRDSLFTQHVITHARSVAPLTLKARNETTQLRPQSPAATPPVALPASCCRAPSAGHCATSMNVAPRFAAPMEFARRTALDVRRRALHRCSSPQALARRMARPCSSGAWALRRRCCQDPRRLTRPPCRGRRRR